MKLSTQTGTFCNRLGTAAGVRGLLDAGYDALDLSCFDMLSDDTDKMGAGAYALARELKAIAEDRGAYFNQAHAPFPSNGAQPGYTEKAFDRIVRSMEFASWVGARNIIVHPVMIDAPYPLVREESLENNIRFYSALLPYAKGFGINIALENMWQYNDARKISPCACGPMEDFCAHLAALDDPHFVACLDVGHAHLCGFDLGDYVRALGSRLKALHVHDVGYGADMHVLPYMAEIGPGYDGLLKALADIGYDGELTFEADNTLARIPDEMLLPTARFMVEIGRCMLRRYEALKG